MAVLMLVCFYILSWEAAETAGRLIDVSGNIKADQVILVDAGHGGVDSGMVGIGGLKEKGINLDIAMKLKTILEKKGLAVVMTREEDKGLYENGTKNMKAQDLQNRIEQIRKYEPVLSVSIHQNSYSDPGVKGPQVFYYEDSEGGKELALAIQENMNRKLSIARPRVAKENRTYYLLKRSPGVINIVECGFLTNPEEAALLQTEKYQRKVAEAVADGIITHNDHIINNLALLRTVIMTGKIFRNRIIYRQYQIIGVTLDRKLGFENSGIWSVITENLS